MSVVSQVRATQSGLGCELQWLPKAPLAYQRSTCHWPACEAWVLSCQAQGPPRPPSPACRHHKETRRGSKKDTGAQ